MAPVDYEYGRAVTQDEELHAEVVGKCSFNSDLFSSQRYLIKEYFHQIDSGVQRLQHSSVLKNHQEILVGKKPYKSNSCGKTLKKLYKLNVW